ncbi:contractile injection system protein, VgrG/Pvc8 family [Acidocella sp. MX-AZ03]|uniref:contractile injection system protein, VgrG/Pvc8 family n=1 Tax=Acidocella sp. MX-AZ03 TaxID=2697363 RepID=UPI0022DD1689|nr:contractile injection system protein, VgrG/Pvc8 family [Acidocella sp. MX-AZ03]WBO60534.1 contractile injection system protein, VgrG/Pvc8 family [Acidocella sp. MX-AZ03]
MSTGIVPNFALIANGSDITSVVQANLSSLTMTDATGYESDSLVIELASTDPANPIRKPPTGAELSLFLGYDGTTINMGMFVADEVEIRGWPEVVTIRARSAIYAPTPAGKTDLQTQYTQVWAAGTTIGVLVQTIAKRHGLAGSTSSALASIPLPHVMQDAESDLNLLTRLAQQYDAVLKVANGQLLFYARATGLSVSGQPLPAITVQASQASSFGMNEQTRANAGTVVACYHVHKTAQKHVVSVGQGEPVKRIRQHFPDQATALAAAKALLAQSIRAQTRLTLSLEGDPAFLAEAPSRSPGFIRTCRPDG